MPLVFRIDGGRADYIRHVQRTDVVEASCNAVVFCTFAGADALKRLGSFKLEVVDPLGADTYCCKATYLDVDGESTLNDGGIAVVSVHCE
jgi:hypothetical protein